MDVEVKTDVWQDAVFKPGFDLISLDSLEIFVKTNYHLPDVPSETQVLTEGILLGEMNSILLKKIEELTLYVIEMNKTLESLKAENQTLIWLLNSK
jgi:hypothetical protein